MMDVIHVVVSHVEDLDTGERWLDENGRPEVNAYAFETRGQAEEFAAEIPNETDVFTLPVVKEEA